MRLRLIESLMLLLLALLAIWDGGRIIVSKRRMLGAMEAGAWIALLGLLLVALCVAHWLSLSREEMRPASSWRDEPGLRRVAAGSALLVGYVAAIDFVGYVLATAMFLVLCFRIFGAYRWAYVLVASTALAIGSLYLWA